VGKEEYRKASVNLLKQFVKTFNSHDLNTLMEFMSDDCVFFSAAGTSPNGEIYRDPDEVHCGYRRIFDAFSDATWSQDNHFVAGNRGFSEWTFSGTNSDGSRLIVRGCDAFVFRGDKIQIKDSFRKMILPTS
jgi:ketosteroid isomerase-like protein